MHPSRKVFYPFRKNLSHGRHASFTVITMEHVMSYSESGQMVVLFPPTPKGKASTFIFPHRGLRRK